MAQASSHGSRQNKAQQKRQPCQVVAGMFSHGFPAIVLFCLACGQPVQGRSAVDLTAVSETYPNLEISLDPPSSPFPEVSAEIGKLEAARDEFESSQMKEVLQAYRKAKTEAERRIGAVVGRAISGFRDSVLVQNHHKSLPRDSDGGKRKSGFHGGSSFFAAASKKDLVHNVLYSVKVKASGSDTPESDVKSSIDSLDHQRSVLEGKRFQQVLDAMGEVTNVVVERLRAELQTQLASLLNVSNAKSGTSFLATSVKELPQQVNARVVPSKFLFPTILSLVEDMEKRRNLSENLIMVRIKQLFLQLLKDENEMIAEALGKSVQRVVASRSPLPRSSSL